MDGLFLWFERVPTGLRLVLLLALLLAFATLDRLLGQEISSKTLFILPVVVAAWSSGRPAAYLVTLITLAVWYAADRWSDAPYANTLGTAAARLLALATVLELVRGARRQLEDERLRALRDPLTGLLNARGLRLRSEQEAARARRYRQPLSVAFIDLDNFKAINDRQGHAAGDTLLRRVAATLRGSLREVDLVARVGGDEFVVVLPDTSSPGAEALLAGVTGQIREGLADSGVTLSTGLVSAVAPSSFADLLGEADRQMYAAKQAGKNRLRVGTLPQRSGSFGNES